MVLLDGKKLALQKEEKLKKEVIELRKRGIIPTLSVILVGDDIASSIYVNMKVKACHRVGIDSVTELYNKDLSEASLLESIKRLNEDPRIDGILVQLPLPKQIHTNSILKAMNPTKDVDGFHPYNMGCLHTQDPSFIPATPMGILQLLDHYEIDICKKNVVVVGDSNIVGKPLSMLMLQRGATISICHIHTQDLNFYTQNADILCTAVGKPNLITKSMVKPGAVIIDIGINRLENGELVGDSAKDVTEKCSYLTPVPGGVGPMTISALLQNTLKAALINKSDKMRVRL